MKENIISDYYNFFLKNVYNKTHSHTMRIEKIAKESAIGSSVGLLALPAEIYIQLKTNPTSNILPDFKKIEKEYGVHKGVLFSKSILFSPIKDALIYRGIIQKGIEYGLEQINVPSSLATAGAVIGSSMTYSMRHPHARTPAFFFGNLLYGALAQYSLWSSAIAQMTHNSTLIAAAHVFENVKRSSKQ